MKPLCFRAPLAAAGVAASVAVLSALSGCANSAGARHGQDQASTSGAKASARMTSGVPGGRMAMMDMMAMCDMHQKMVSPKTPEEQQASVNEHMKNVSPEKREKTISLMREKCK
jgi:hypothetical protein